MAAQHSISRQDQDALAYESQKRAAHVVADGRFSSQIVPVEMTARGNVTIFDTNEIVGTGTALEDFRKAAPRVPEGRDSPG